MPDPVAILMLEDSPLDAELTTAKLSKAPFLFTVDHVENREEFIQALDQRHYDIILADFALPDFDGMNALKIVRERDVDIPFIFVSGMLGEDVAVEALHRGATDYVLKQRLDRLVPSIERALREADAREERLRSAAALHRSESLREKILDNTQDCVLTVDTSGRVLTINKGGRAAFGLQHDASVEEYRWPTLWRDSPGSRAAFQSALNGKSATFEGALQSRDGVERWHEVVLSPLPDADGHIACILAVARDVTERRELLRRERQSRSDAENKARELEKSLLDLESYAFVASHDLQEPVRVIRTYAQLLDRRCGNTMDPSCRQFLGLIEENAGRMHLLIRDLLAYSRVVHEEESIELLDTESILDDVLHTWAAAIRDTGVQVCREPLAPIRGHRGQILQVFHNLLENAIKYRSTSSTPTVKVGSIPGRDFSTFYVKDNGIGFDPQYAERIFQIFRRLHGKEYPGSGVGLAICKRVVERHAGRIWAESAVGNGAAFYFQLPHAERADASSGD